MIRRPQRLIQRFIQDQGGLAAIEFALIAPLMMLIYFGLVEFCQAYMANRRANHTASIIADLVAQSETTTTQELSRAFELGAVILKPFSAAPLSIRVTSISLDSQSRAKVDWSRSSGTALPALTKGAAITQIPTGIVGPGESLILGESHYSYSSSAMRVIDRDFTFTRSYYLRPRVSDKVPCSNC